MRKDPTRRRFVQTLGIGGSVALAGCSNSGEPEDDVDTESPSQTEPPNSPEETTEPEQSEASLFEQAGLMTASDGDEGDRLGWSVSVSASGSTAIVSAFHDEDPNGTEAGSVYVFSRSNGSWAQQAKLTADDGRVADSFGSSVSITDDGTTALIGADGNRNSNNQRSGTAYVFSKADESWSQQAKLIADDNQAGDSFGWEVEIAGDGSTALIGAFDADRSSSSSEGAAYVFSNSDGSWSQQAKLKPDSPNQFGYSIGMTKEGTRAIISNGGGESSAYLFSRSSGSWQEEAEIIAEDVDAFGEVVEITNDGTTVIVTAFTDTTANGERSGSAYIFSQADNAWTQEAKLVPDDGGPGEQFGISADIFEDGRSAIVGTERQAEYSGAAYVFSRSDGSWSQQAKLTPDNAEKGTQFGTSIAVSDDNSMAIIGADGYKGPNGDDSGVAYAFESTGEDIGDLIPMPGEN
ncbi:PKD domain-containing protein [Haloarcula laminariae]|uniref:PKD domain-containing protein n=1 Tax=Haloarcula laminariae TaxID=2961577 RepID=UPI0024074B16|nr:PKD domain-containing protein [Halomicroarcula sp. FL173]